MARTSRLFTYTVLILLILLISFGAFYLYNKYGRGASSPLAAVPVGTGVFFKLNEPGKLLHELGSGNLIWADLASTNDGMAFVDKIHTADSVIAALGYTELIEKGSVFVAIAENNGELASCIIFEWPYGASEVDLQEVIDNITDNELSEVTFKVSRGLCIIGSNEYILNECLIRLEDKIPLPDADLFEKVAATSGTNVDANIYVNFEKVPSLAETILSSSYLSERPILPHFGSWSEIDLLIKDDELLMNGYSEAVDSLDQFLTAFKRQEARKIEITRVLPYNTSILVSFGFSDYLTLFDDLGRFLDHSGVYPERKAGVEKLKSNYGPNVVKYMTDWIGNEMALAEINPHLDDREANTFMAIHAGDIEKAEQHLSSLASSQYNSTYRDYRIKRISIPNLIPLIYGRLFGGIEKNYYTRIEDYIVFANSKASIENFINIFLSGKTLEQNENFKGFVDNVSDRSNIFGYFNIRNSAGLLERTLAPPFDEFIQSNKGLIMNFEALAVQFKTLNNMYFTSMYLKHNPSYIKEDLSLWKAYLDAPVYGKPYFVKDHRTNNLKIVAFDTLNTMYLIDHEGNIDWKLNIGEKVISDVHTVDFYKNGKIQYLFNTASRIYLIDLLGRDVEGYPVELRDKATNGLAVFDYDRDRNYRVLIALEDNRVYNYDIKGKKVEGWKNPLSKGKVTRPVQHLRDGGKDYIIIVQADAFIFGSPNHGRTITAGMTNFLSRMMPLLKMDVKRDESGTIIDAQSKPLIRGKKAVMVVSQGDPWPTSSSLALKILDDNIKDFQLKKVGEVFSMFNLQKGEVSKKQSDLDLAFAMGVRLGMSLARS